MERRKESGPGIGQFGSAAFLIDADVPTSLGVATPKVLNGPAYMSKYAYFNGDAAIEMSFKCR